MCGRGDRRLYDGRPGEKLIKEVAPELHLREWAGVFRCKASPALSDIFSPMYPSNSWSLCQGSPNLALQQIHQELSKMAHPGPTPKENLCSLRSEGESCALARFGNHYSHSIPFILFTEDLH